MNNCRSLFLVSLRSYLGATLPCLAPFALAGATDDSAINATKNKVTQDASFAVYSITPSLFNKNNNRRT